MIAVLYQRIPLLLHDDEKLHLEALEREGKEICQQLKESVLRMTQQGESLKEVYRELTAMCHKPDTELLQVRKEGPTSERETLFQTSCCDTKMLAHIRLLSAKGWCSLTPIIFLKSLPHHILVIFEIFLPFSYLTQDQIFQCGQEYYPDR